MLQGNGGENVMKIEDEMIHRLEHSMAAGCTKQLIGVIEGRMDLCTQVHELLDDNRFTKAYRIKKAKEMLDGYIPPRVG